MESLPESPIPIRKIILVPNASPKLVGKWRVDELYQMADGFGRWVGSRIISDNSENNESNAAGSTDQPDTAV